MPAPALQFYAQLNPSQYAAYGGDSALQIPVTWEMFQLHNKIMNITVTGDSGRRVSYADLCLRKLDGTCDTANGYLWYFYKVRGGGRWRLQASEMRSG